ncbi:MAG TPA: hypothetical protein VGP06_17345, partial [Janthinobacterium sp.]|nr:hypothetical protein [Janthinobacterium sp.]
MNTSDTSKKHNAEQRMTQDLDLDKDLRQAEQRQQQGKQQGAGPSGSGQGGSRQSGQQNERNLQGGQQTGLMQDGDSFNTALG